MREHDTIRNGRDEPPARPSVHSGRAGTLVPTQESNADALNSDAPTSLAPNGAAFGSLTEPSPRRRFFDRCLISVPSSQLPTSSFQLPTSSSQPGYRQAAFTLIEVLVSCAVLALVVVMVAQMVSSATSVTGASRKRVDADDEARMVFDRMGEDFAQMLRRPDVNPILLASSNSPSGNAELYFYSQAPASSIYTNSSNSQIALIGYQVMTNGLARLGIEQAWDTLSFSTNAMSNMVATNQSAASNATTSANYHVIAPSVFRMEFALLMKPGGTNNPSEISIITNGTSMPVSNPLGTAYTNSTNALSPTTNGTNVFFQTNNAGQGLKDVEAIIVALAILAQTSQKIVTPGALSTLATSGGMPNAVIYPSGGSGTLTGTSGNGLGTNGTSIPAGQWEPTNPLLNMTGIPPAARAQIRIYQRTFPIAP